MVLTNSGLFRFIIFLNSIFFCLWLMGCSPQKGRSKETRGLPRKHSGPEPEGSTQKAKEEGNQSYEVMLDSIPANVYGERVEVSGDFNGDGSQEVLIERYVNCKSGKEIAKNTSYKFDDFFEYQQWVGRRCPICYLEDKVGKLTKLSPIKDAASQVGFSFVENIGDVDGLSGDEIAFTINYIVMSSRGNCQIWTYKHGKWKEIRTINFHFEEIKHPDYPCKPYLFKEILTDKYGVLYRRKLNGRVKYIDPMSSGTGWVDLLTGEEWLFDMIKGPEGE